MTKPKVGMWMAWRYSSTLSRHVTGLLCAEIVDVRDDGLCTPAEYGPSFHVRPLVLVSSKDGPGFRDRLREIAREHEIVVNASTECAAARVALLLAERGLSVDEVSDQ